jgi:hypothetical protein
MNKIYSRITFLYKFCYLLILEYVEVIRVADEIEGKKDMEFLTISE